MADDKNVGDEPQDVEDAYRMRELLRQAIETIDGNDLGQYFPDGWHAEVEDLLYPPTAEETLEQLERSALAATYLPPDQKPN